MNSSVASRGLFTGRPAGVRLQAAKSLPDGIGVTEHVVGDLVDRGCG